MTKDEVVMLICCIKSNYQHSYTEKEAKLLVNIWFECLKNCDSKLIFKALVEVFKTSKYPPQIANLLEVYNELNNKLKSEERIKIREAELKKIKEENDKISPEQWTEIFEENLKKIRKNIL